MFIRIYFSRLIETEESLRREFRFVLFLVFVCRIKSDLLCFEIPEFFYPSNKTTDPL